MPDPDPDLKPDEKGDNPDPKPDETVTVPKEEFEKLQGSVSELTTKLNYATDQLFTRQPQQAYTPVPETDNFDKELKAYSDEIASLNAKMDEAVIAGEPAAQYRNRISELEFERGTAVSKRNMEAMQKTSVDNLSSLTAQVVKTEMPYLSVPDVRKTYETSIAQLPAESKANPEVLMAAYKLAIGEHTDKIIEEKIQEASRQANADTEPNDTTTTTSRATDFGDKIPDPEEVLGADTMKSLAMIGRSVDRHYQGLGYPGGFEEFWKETGKDAYEKGEL